MLMEVGVVAVMVVDVQLVVVVVRVVGVVMVVVVVAVLLHFPCKTWLLHLVAAVGTRT